MLRVLASGVLALSLAACSTSAPADDPDGGSGGALAEGCEGDTYPPPEAALYVLPYPAGTGYRMNLGNCSSRHPFHGPDSNDRHAYDFVMEIGTPVTASRAGVVVHVEERGVDGQHPNNLVVVDHGDGTFGQYMHLTQNGADVDVGERVVQGSPIGRSGNTGLAGTPHLHFVVTEGGWEWPYRSAVASFSNARPAHAVLAEGRVYTAATF